MAVCRPRQATISQHLSRVPFARAGRFGEMSARQDRRWPTATPAEVLRTWWHTIRVVLARPGEERDTALLLGKAALATVLAWQVAAHILHSQTPFYAPMAALLVVDRTLVRSLWASARRLAAVVVGMTGAWLVGSLVGVHWWSMLPVLALALLLSRWRQFGEHGIQVPTMVLLSLLTVGGTNADFSVLTIVETLVGGAIGVATNAVVFAPLHIQAPREQVAELARQVRHLLRDMAEGLRSGWDADLARGWYGTSTELAQRAPGVIELLEVGRESTRFNPRDQLLGLAPDWVGYERAVEALRRAQWQVSGMARTLADAADDALNQPAPSEEFLDDFATALDEVVEALRHYGLQADDERELVSTHLAAARDKLARIGDKVRQAPLSDAGSWPAYGAMLLDAQRLVRELAAYRDDAVVPTDSGPQRIPGRAGLRRPSPEPT